MAVGVHRHGDLDISEVAFNSTGTDGDPVALTADPAPGTYPNFCVWAG